MRRFFERADTRWRRPRGALHLYVVPDEADPVRERFDAQEVALRTCPGLAMQPNRYLHATIQRLDLYRDEISEERWQALVRELGDALARHEPFPLRFAVAQPREYAIEAVAEPTAQWTALVAGIREAIAAAGFGAALTDPPYGPHYTLAYCTGDVDEERIREALRPVIAPTDLTVRRVSLVGVEQRLDAGIFTFDDVFEWTIGSSVARHRSAAREA